MQLPQYDFCLSHLYLFACSKPEASCLLDLPGKNHRVDFEKLDNKPGVLYDIDKQCEMIAGTGSKFCKEKVSRNVQRGTPLNCRIFKIEINRQVEQTGTQIDEDIMQASV